MIYSIENDRFVVEISDKGAELQSIRSKISGEEFLWQGDPAIWSGRSPLLFPVVGKLKDDRFIYRGSEYKMSKHGFASTTDFSLAAKDYRSLTLRCDGRRQTENYPFDFNLNVTYDLSCSVLGMKYYIENIGFHEMYFSIGAHPGFQCAMGDWIEFAKDETADAHQLVGSQMLLSKNPVVRGIEDHRLVITPDIFKADALIFDGLCSQRATLFHDGRPHVEVDYGDAPCLGVWAKPGASYVCIEPWYGIDDREDATGHIEDKPYIIKLDVGENFKFEVTVTMFE